MKSPSVAVAAEADLIRECIAAWESRQMRLQNPNGELPMRLLAAAVGLRQVPDPAAREPFPDELSRLLDTVADAAKGEDPVRTTGLLFARLVARMTPYDLRRWRTNLGRRPPEDA